MLAPRFASLMAMPLLGVAFAAPGQSAVDAVIGKWKTFDDATGKAMSITEVYRTKSGAIAARVHVDTREVIEFAAGNRAPIAPGCEREVVRKPKRRTRRSSANTRHRP